MKFFSVLPLLFCFVQAAPKLRVLQKQMPAPLLTLPSNATSIRADIDDSFSCEGREYGYYADVENECQLFHVCLPVTYSNGRSQTFRWSFICPEETVFNQEIFTCTRSDESIDCAESPRYYNLNNNFGDDMSPEMPEEESVDDGVHATDAPQDLDAKPVDSAEEPVVMPEIVKSSTAPTPVHPIYNRRVMIKV